MFSCEICEIFKNAYVEEYLLTTASDSQTLKLAKALLVYLQTSYTKPKE